MGKKKDKKEENLYQGSRSVHVGGSVSGSTIITGDDNCVGNVSETKNIFAPVYEAVQQSERPHEIKAGLSADVEEIEAEVLKDEEIDEGFLARRMRSLKAMAPDIFAVLLAALQGPGAVVNVTARKIGEKIEAEG